MLLKYYPGTGLRTAPDLGILEWLDSHSRCHPSSKAFHPNLDGNPGFSLHTEDDLGKDLSFELQNSSPRKD